MNVMQTGRSVFPFTAIVGQDLMKQALILNAINPAIGGVLIRGEKGTAKSTAVRSLTKLLPGLDVVADCRYGCPPDDADLQCIECTDRVVGGETLPRGRRRMRVVELPINASEDRVVGAIDIEAAIKRGEKEFEPGVLAEANRNILYVDEVNLLDDHIVDVLLDAAAMGQNTVEREGVSVSHPSRFILVGTMNPEEGELRPQLLDRFGLCVDVEGIRDVRQRVEIVERREAFEEDPSRFRRAFRARRTGGGRPYRARDVDALRRRGGSQHPRGHRRAEHRARGGRPPRRHRHAQGGAGACGARGSRRGGDRRRRARRADGAGAPGQARALGEPPRARRSCGDSAHRARRRRRASSLGHPSVTHAS